MGANYIDISAHYMNVLVSNETGCVSVIFTPASGPFYRDTDSHKVVCNYHHAYDLKEPVTAFIDDGKCVSVAALVSFVDRVREFNDASGAESVVRH